MSNSLDVGLAFVEGLALIASPCILPVLPLVLSTSIDGGKARPFGIIAGFVASFSAFVLLSRRIVETLHIDTDAIRYVSLGLLAFLGLVLLSDKLSGVFSRLTQGAADFGGKFGAGGQGGFASGLVIGSLIGFVWTPCAGPILAAVLVQVIRQQTDAQGIFVTLAFAFGAGIPMLAIALTGRKLMNRFSFLTQHTETVRKIFAVLILISVVLLGFGTTNLQSIFQSGKQEQGAVLAENKLTNPLEKPYPAPEFAGIQQWLNSNPLTMASLKGKVVLVDFWTYSCINCVRTLPYVTAWDRRYRDKGLVIVGVHSPEFEFEKNIGNIKTAVAQDGIQYPVAVDSNLETWLAFKNIYWPAHYLIDRNGQVVYTHFGEGDYDITENNIRYLLGLKGSTAPNEPYTPHAADQTPETYFGTKRAARFDGMPLLKPGLSDYRPVGDLAADHWTLGGKWKVEGQKITAQEAGAILWLNFTARKVFVVMGTADGSLQKVELSLDEASFADNAGKDATSDGATIHAHTLYELVKQPQMQNGVLEIKTTAPGLEIYAVTFGN